MGGANEALDFPTLRALCDNATPGPWWTHPGAGCDLAVARGWVLCGLEDGDQHLRVADAAFIAAAREALPKALDEIERLRVQTQSDACAIAYREDELAAMRPVVGAARVWCWNLPDGARIRTVCEFRLIETIRAYRAAQEGK